MFILDCSVTMAWCFKEEDNQYADKVLNSLQTQTAVVPQLWHLEVANVLLVAKRRKKINDDLAQDFMSLLQNLDIQTDKIMKPLWQDDIFQYGDDYGLSAYDAIYFSIAKRENLPIATCDKSLMQAAEKADLLF